MPTTMSPPSFLSIVAPMSPRLDHFRRNAHRPTRVAKVPRYFALDIFASPIHDYFTDVGDAGVVHVVVVADLFGCANFSRLVLV
jgi:hypothetical protein